MVWLDTEAVPWLPQVDNCDVWLIEPKGCVQVCCKLQEPFPLVKQIYFGGIGAQ